MFILVNDKKYSTICELNKISQLAYKIHIMFCSFKVLY